MSPRKLTEDDKQEILQLYRNSEATTSTLASNYEVSSSTISRFLKNKLTSAEYEDLIQQKRLARTPRGEKSTKTVSTSDKSDKSDVGQKTKVAKAKKEKAKTKSRTKVKTAAKTKTKASAKAKPAKSKKKDTEEIKLENSSAELEVADNVTDDKIANSDPALDTVAPAEIESKPVRRRRRRSSYATDAELKAFITTPEDDSAPQIEQLELENLASEESLESKPNRLVIDRQPSGNPQTTAQDAESIAALKSSSLILKGDRPDLDDNEDEEDEDLITLKEMLGEDLEDINDDEDDEDDWDEENEEELTQSTTSPSKSSNLADVNILPLSQASFPQTCYLVIDRSAELIVKPLADFADLGMIPQEEVKQRTLPVFDNHRIAKRFSNRRERVIKVPNGQMLQKTSHHLEYKGITRLLMDGQIYSLSD